MAIKTVLIDLSGTLHIENTVTLGAVDALKRLRNAAVNIKFVTNTTKESGKCLCDRLKRLGFEIQLSEIFSSLSAAKVLIDKNKWQRPMLLIEQSAMDDFPGVNQPVDDQIADAVIIGLTPSQFCYPVLNTAFRHIINGAKLVAIHQARYFKEPDGLSLGPGGFVKALEYAADCKAQVVGKPQESFFLAALEGQDPHQAVMIGDDARDDIQGAQACGIRGYLVKTGKYRAGDENKISPPPHAVCDNFAQVVDLVLEELQS